MGTIGRWLQILALILLPLAIILELSGQLGRNPLSDLLMITLFGATAFYLGRVLEQYGSSPKS